MKNVAAIVELYSHVRLAEPKDNEEILHLLRSQGMQTKDYSIGFDRGPDFFSFYRLSSRDFRCFLFLNDDQSIGGLGAVLFQDVHIRGQQERVGYFCDLRVDSKASKTTHLQWRDFYADLVEALPELEDQEERCAFLYTSVFDTNERALRALTKKLKRIRYVPFYPYQTQNLLLNPLAHFSFGKSAVREEREIEAVWWEQQKQSHSLTMTQPAVHGMERPYLSLYSQDGRRIASCKPWVSDGLRAPRVGGLNSRLEKLGASLKFLGRPAIRNNENMRQIFLTHLSFAPNLTAKERAKARKHLVNHVYRSAVREKIHLVSWIEAQEEGQSSKTQLSFKTPAHLYEVSAADAPSRATDLASSSVYFEGALL